MWVLESKGTATIYGQNTCKTTVELFLRFIWLCIYLFTEPLFKESPLRLKSFLFFKGRPGQDSTQLHYYIITLHKYYVIVIVYCPKIRTNCNFNLWQFSYFLYDFHANKAPLN